MNSIIILSIIFWIAVICIAVVAILGLILAIMKIPIDATKKIAASRNKFSITSLIISAIFIIIVSFSILNYFVWKSPTDKHSKNQSLKEPLQKGEPIKQVQSQAPVPVKKPFLTETSIKQVKSQVVTPPKEAVSQGKKKVPKEKRQKKLLQPLKPSKAMFTVQTGAFSDFSHAKSLKGRLNKKGYNAYITSSTTAEGKLYKVCIGKFTEREKAKTLSEKIRSSEVLETFVTSLQP